MSAPSAFTSRLDGLMLSVTPENVLRIRDTLQSEATRMQEDYDRHSWNASHLPVLGPDPVSGPAAAAFNSRLPGVVDQFKAIIDEVKATVLALTETAQSYGLTEADIATTMHGIGSEGSGARLVATDATVGQPTVQPDVPGLAANKVPDASAAALEPNPAPNGVDPGYIRRVLDPNIQAGMGRP